MENIERFNAYAAKTFAKLYSAFPEPIRLDCREIVYDQPFPDSVHVKELQEATSDLEIRFCAAALTWLHDTGYFNGDLSVHSVLVQRAVLTPKGFEAMATTPAALESDGPVGRQLVALAKVASKEQFKQKIGDLVGWAISAGVKSSIG